MRTKDNFMKMKKYKNLEDEFIFTFGDAIQEKFKSAITIKILFLGSFKIT